MEEQKQTYKYLDQFIHDSFVNPQNIIYKELEITPVDSVRILITEQTDASILIVQGYSTSILKPINKDNITIIHMGIWQLQDIVKQVEI